MASLRRQRLSWYSLLTGHALFVNPRGQKIADTDLDTLARQISAGRAQLVTEDKAGWSTVPGKPAWHAARTGHGRTGDPRMKAVPPQDTRRAPRRQVSDLVPVTDQMRECVVGRLGNVSETGMLMLASVPLREDALYQLRFLLPLGDGRQQAIDGACICYGASPRTYQGRAGPAASSPCHASIGSCCGSGWARTATRDRFRRPECRFRHSGFSRYAAESRTVFRVEPPQ